MTEVNAQQRPSEFIALAAFLMATIALAIDMMLPAMGSMAIDLGLTETHRISWVILGIFVGLIFGQLVFGPLSDAIGRRGSIQIGILIFLFGTAICAWTESFEVLIAGRVLQGFGGAATRIVTQAMVRDRFAGREMARIMSFVMTIFILVPIFAPMIGQVVLWLGSWHLLFITLGGFSTVILVWFSFRQPETLAARRPITPEHLTSAFKTAVTNRKTIRFTIAAGVSFGGLVSYLSSAQHIFQDIYQTGDWFPVILGSTAASIAISSLANARYVRRYGMEVICKLAFTSQIVWSGLFCLYFINGSELSLNGLLVYIVPVLFLMGLTFGNLQSVAMEPMGAIAGTASTVIGSLMTAISLAVGIVFSQFMVGSPGPLIVNFFLTGLIALILISTTKSQRSA
jgi:DHA1 family bicyclomycin/chloramphenicol resistance-like MFS transporter